MCDEAMTRFNTIVGPPGALVPFTGTALAVLQAKHRHGMSHAVVMTAHTWHGLQSQVPVPDCVNVVIDDGTSSHKYCNGVCSVGSLEAALVACATFQAVDSVFVIGEDAVVEAAAHFVDGIDYVYFIGDTDEALVTDETAWYADAALFSLLGDVKCPGLTSTAHVYGSIARLDTPRTLTPWVVQRLPDEHEQLQYNRTMASVVRNGAYDNATETFVQAGLLMRFSLRNNAVPVLTTVSVTHSTHSRLASHDSVSACYRAYVECHEERAVASRGLASVAVPEIHATLHFGRIAAPSTQLSCTAFFTTGSVDSVAIACVALFTHRVAMYIGAQAHDLSVCYATVRVPLHAEAAVLALLARTTKQSFAPFPTPADFPDLPDVRGP